MLGGREGRGVQICLSCPYIIIVHIRLLLRRVCRSSLGYIFHLLFVWRIGYRYRGYLCETGILLLALSRYTGDPDVIDHCGLVWGGLCLELSLGCCADNIIIPLDLTQLFCPGFTLAAGPPSSFTTNIVGCWGEPCAEPAISLHSYTVPLVQWSTRSPGGYLCETGILLLALSCYRTIKI